MTKKYTDKKTIIKKCGKLSFLKSRMPAFPKFVFCDFVEGKQFTKKSVKVSHIYALFSINTCL